jgi:regulator of sirC expression with transglutaminase-like and TPR domain
VDGDGMAELARRLQVFREVMSGTDSTLDLMALTLSAVLQPRLDIPAGLSELDQIADACRDRSRDGVVRSLVDECGFRGDEVDYHGWQNSCLDRVVARRRGMPITLSIVTIEVGRRLGVELVGVGLPGHFLVGDPNDPNWFADPFHGRTGMSRSDCQRLVASLGAGGWRDSFTEPTPDRLVIARILNNLRATCERRDDRLRLAIVMRLRTMQQLGDRPGDVRRASAILN